MHRGPRGQGPDLLEENDVLILGAIDLPFEHLEFNIHSNDTLFCIKLAKLGHHLIEQAKHLLTIVFA